MSTAAIVQARMGASRLPNKMLLHLHGHPVVEWVFRRLGQAQKLDRIIFALPDTPQDDVLAWYLESIGAIVFRGSETDLVARYYQAAKQYGVTELVRVCADNPLICASEVDRLVDFFHANLCDYAYNHIPKGNSYPDGLGAEICRFDLLERMYVEAKSPDQREHLFNYLWDNHGEFVTKTIEPPESISYPELKLDLDIQRDYQALLERPYRLDMSAEEIVATALR